VRREYDLFEITDGRPRWRSHVIGTLQAGAKLQELGRKTRHECFVALFPSHEVVARVNLGSSASRKPSVFQITYDYTQAIARVQLLRLHGCDVAFAIGNEAAKIILGRLRPWDLCTVGYAAPHDTVRDMVEWLKANYPGVPILELTSPRATQLPVVNHSPHLNSLPPWLSAVANALSTARPPAEIKSRFSLNRSAAFDLRP
jgi:hypothetical protein